MMETEKMIFVFGSNLSGIHGAGAAKYAHTYMDAEWGVGEGITGKCYALPTKGKNITLMSINQVRQSVNTFLAHAYVHPDDHFMVTQVGCGLGGFTRNMIAPMFINATKNCYFDLKWKPFLPEAKFWGTF